jgi:hypothetical protein
MSLFEHRDGSGAAKVMRLDVARDSDFFTELAEVEGECAGVVVTRVRLSSPALMVLDPELTDEGHRAALVAFFDDFLNFSCDREREVLVAFCNERERPARFVVVLWTDPRRCAAADREVATEEEPEPDVWRRGFEEFVSFVVMDRDVAWARFRVAPDFLIELWRSVVLPEIPEDVSDAFGIVREGCWGKVAASKLLVEVNGVSD